MRSSSWKVGVAAVAIVALLISGTLFITRNNKVLLTGQILKVRTQLVEMTSAIAVLDVRINNPSNQQFMVKDVGIQITDVNGKVVDGELLADSEANRIFDYFKALGPKYNPTLLIRNRIKSGETVDRTLTVKFPIAATEVESRKLLRINLTDADGAVTSIESKP